MADCMLGLEKKSAVRDEFSFNAGSYGQYNIIQNKVVTKLLSAVADKPRSVLDLGCGSGAVYKALTWPLENFIAVDFASAMLALHPKGPGIETVLGDFNDPELFGRLRGRKFDRIVSASALQWAADLDLVFSHLSRLGAPVSLAIFTAGTFRSIHETAGLQPFLRSADETQACAAKYFAAEFSLERYTLDFPSVRDMFRYIKKSGVSGGRKMLDFRQAKQLMSDYPLRHLEFEVLFMHT
jgi:malonyl-CoA O-methyltransferase